MVSSKLKEKIAKSRAKGHRTLFSINDVHHRATHSRRFCKAMMPYMTRLSASLKVPRRSPPTIPDGVTVRYLDFPSIEISEFEAAKGGWMAKDVAMVPAKTWSVDELLDMGFDVEDWDGESVYLLRDKKLTVFGALAGKFGGDKEALHVRKANEAFKEAQVAGLKSKFLYREKDNRRGTFKCIVSGVSMGGGQVEPKAPTVKRSEADVIEKLLGNAHVERIAAFQNSALAAYFPRLYEVMHNYMTRLYEHLSHLMPNFPGISVFPTSTFNVGPLTTTVNHLDNLNMVHGICAITALGQYDCDRGGHLILFKLKRLIRFPPGSTILIPSSILEHGNTPIIGHGTRFSLTQYFPAGIIRYVDYGYTTGTALEKSGPVGAAKKVKIDGDEVNRLRRSLHGFSKSHRLGIHRERAFSSPNPISQPSSKALPRKALI